MEILQLVYRVVTKGLDDANQKLHQVQEETKKAAKATDKLNESFDGLSDVGGPVGEAADQVRNLKDQASSAVGAVRNLGAVSVPLVAALAGVAGVISALRFAPVLDSLGDLSTRLGMNLSQVTALDDKLGALGGASAYASDLDKVARALSKADEEGSRSAEAFRRLGINIDAVKSPQEALNSVVEKYAKKVQSGNITLGEQQALITALGPAYKDMIFRQQEAAAALEIYNEFAREGLGISQSGADAADAFGDAQDRLSYVMKIVGSQLNGEIVPAFTGLINALVDSYKNGGLVKATFDGIRVAVQLVMVPIRALFNIFILLDAAVQSVGKSLGALFAAIATRSTEPFKNLKEDLAVIWSTANSRTTSPTWDSGVMAPPTQSSVGGGAGGGVGSGGKPKDPIQTPEYREAMRRAQERSALKNSEYEGIDKYLSDLYIKQAEEARKLAQENTKLADSYRDMIDPSRVLQREIEAINNSMLTTEEKSKAIEIVKNRFYNLKETVLQTGEKFDIMGRVGETAFKGLEDALTSFASTGKLNFGQLASSIIADLARIYVQMTIIKPLMNGFMSFMGGGSFLGGLFGNAVGSLAGAGFGTGLGYGNLDLGGFFADGGNPPVGKVSVVGERGPELFIPKTAGTIIPNHALGGQNIQVVVNVQGGENARETGTIVSNEVVKVMRSIVRQELGTAKRAQAYAA